MTKSAVIVGAGALGSHVLLFARNLPVRFKVIDFDRVESKNILAQFHTQMGRGKNKAQGLQQALQGLFGVKIDAVPHKLRDDNVEALLGGADMVIDCLDNAASRRIVQTFCVERQIACLHGALAADGSYARVMWSEHFAIDEEGAEGQATCEGGEHLPFIAVTAARMAHVLQCYVDTGHKSSLHLHPGGLMKLSG